MKLIHIGVIVCSVIFVTGIYFYFTDEEVKKESLFDVSIKERLIFKLDRKTELYTYNFHEKKFDLFSENKIITPIQYEWNTSKKVFIKENIYLFNGELFINGRKESKCNILVCPYYLDKSGKYLILIDRKIYKDFFFTKLLAQHVFKIFNLETGEYMSIQSFTYMGKEKYNFDLIGYVE
ncbi:MAG: hypothetical protein WC774_02270 [Candidatus Gracilibacteria bacterium]